MIDWEDDIKRYHNGEMTPEEQHALEKKALSDPFLAEALEGAGLITAQAFSADLAEVQKRIHQKTKKKIWMWPLRIAASLALIVISYLMIVPFIEKDTHQELALQKPITPEQKSKAKDQIEGITQHVPQETSTLADQPVSDLKKEKSLRTPRGNKIQEQENTADQALVIPSQNKEQTEDKFSEKELAKELAEGQRVAAAQEEILQSKIQAQSIRSEEKKSVMRSKGLITDQRVVQGKVVLAEDNTPIPGVNIVIKGTNRGTVTDINGEYKLTLNTADPKLVYSFIGFQTREVDVNNQNEMIVSLETDASQLSEVVVTGYSPYRTDEAREPFIKLAEPAGGRRAYDKYLKSNLHYPQQALANQVKGRVTVSFTVRTDGSLAEFNVVKGLGYGCDEEVIRMVKEGPKWSPTTEDSVPVESEVRVRVKFALPD
jgi:TonB family protein